jgi:hypothetical protein
LIEFGAHAVGKTRRLAGEGNDGKGVPSDEPDGSFAGLPAANSRPDASAIAGRSGPDASGATGRVAKTAAEAGAPAGEPAEAPAGARWPAGTSRDRRRLLPSGMGMRRLSIGPSGGGRSFAARPYAGGEPATGTRAGWTITALGTVPETALVSLVSWGCCAQAGAAPMASTASTRRPAAIADDDMADCPSMVRPDPYKQ